MEKIETMDISNHFWDFSINGNRELEQKLVKNGTFVHSWAKKGDLLIKKKEEWLKWYIKEWEKIGLVSHEKELVLGRRKENSSLNID